MSAESLELKIFTPAGLQIEDRATTVTLASSQGEIGILPRHTRYTGLLGTGVMTYLATETSQPVRLVVSNGFCTVNGESLTILADAIDTLQSVNRNTYAGDRTALQKTIAGGNTLDPAWTLAQTRLARIEAIDSLIAQ